KRPRANCAHRPIADRAVKRTGAGRLPDPASRPAPAIWPVQFHPASGHGPGKPTPGPRQPRFSSKLDFSPQLDRSRLVALQRHQPELARAPILVRIAEDHPVGDVASLGFEPPAEMLSELSHLEDAHVLHSIRESA